MANAHDVPGTIKAALTFDPGKPPLYHLMLHFVCRTLGVSETAVRALSAVLGVASVAAAYIFGTKMLGEKAGALGATLWAICPVAFLFARWARMYSAFVALVIVAMWALWMAREKANVTRLAFLTLSTAAMLYVHMSAVFYLGAALLICARDIRQGRVTSWRLVLSLACGVLLFTPFLGIEIQQARELLFGHWLDWSGARAPVNGWGIAAGLMLAVIAIAASLRFDKKGRDSAWDPIWFCLIWCAVPAAALIAISLAARPVMQLRYVAPSLPPLMLVAAAIVQRMRPTISHAIVGAAAGIFVMGIVLVERIPANTWRDIATQVSSSPSQPVFFERGFVVLDEGASAPDNAAFPQGYYRAAFDYYCKGPIPRLTVDPQDLESARHQISVAAQSNLGAWLVTGKGESVIPAELPAGNEWQIVRYPYETRVTLWHLEPSPVASISAQY